MRRSRGGLAVRSDDPTPEQIAATIEEIQAEWTDEEREKRAHGRGLDALIKAHAVANRWHREHGTEPEVDE